MSKLLTINASMLAGVLLLSAGCATPERVKLEHVETRKQVTSNDNTNLVTILGGQVKVVQGDISGIQSTIDQVKEENRKLRDAYDTQKKELEEASNLAKKISEALVAFGGSLPALAGGNPVGTFNAAARTVGNLVAAKDAAKESDDRVEAALNAKIDSANERIGSVEDGVEANTDSIKSRFDKLNGELQEKITDVAADSEAIRDLEGRLNDLPDEASRKTELGSFLKEQGFTPDEIGTLFDSFSMEELLVLLGVGGASVGGSRRLSRSKERIEAGQKETAREIANAKAEMLAMIESRRPTTESPPTGCVREIAAAKAEVLAKIEATKPTNVTPPGKAEA